VLPLLLNRLESQEVVVYSYAAVALDRILSMRAGGSTTLMYVGSSLLLRYPYNRVCRFSSVDVQPFAPQLLNVILAKIAVQQSPERTAENDFLMRCAYAFHTLHVVPDKCLSRCRESRHHGEAGARRRVRHRSAKARRHPPQSRPKPE
jgi:hypothetical protein